MNSIIDQILDSPIYNIVVKKSDKDTISKLFKVSENNQVNAFTYYCAVINISENMPYEIAGSFKILHDFSFFIDFCHENNLISDQERQEKSMIIRKYEEDLFYSHFLKT